MQNAQAFLRIRRRKTFNDESVVMRSISMLSVLEVCSDARARELALEFVSL